MKKITDSFEKNIFQMAEKEKMMPPDRLYREVSRTLSGLPGHRHVFHMTWKKAVVLAAALIVMCSGTVMAAVGAMRQRMEAMNLQEMEDYFTQIHTSRLGADNYNRPLTEEEQSRMEELNGSYEQDGLFPEKTLAMISSPEAYRGTGVAFYRDTSTFFLPEKHMSDEELLQMIDFVHKRDYSLQTVNEKISAGEIPSPLENTDYAKSSETEEAIPYSGELEIQKIAAGQNCIFLAGKNSVHRMEIGSSDSELFFDDFDTDTYISALCEDKKGNVYLALSEQISDTSDATEGVTIAGRRFRPSLWILNPDGAVTGKVDLTTLSLGENDHIRIVRKMTTDEQGHIFLRADGLYDALLIVLDDQGNYLKAITSETYTCHDMGGLGIGRDGTVYTQIESGQQLGIASVDLKKGSLDEIYLGIVPDGTVMLDLIAPGSGADLVFWGYDGIFTYHPGDERAVNILPAYEAPCNWENVMCCALPDGRIVFGACTEYRQEGEEVFRVPEKTSFYYQPTTQ